MRFLTPAARTHNGQRILRCELPLIAIAAVLLFFLHPAVATADQASQCFGSTANGRIDGAVMMPTRGENFQPYSGLASALGRTYLHSVVRDVVLACYAALERTAPDKCFVYGETGSKTGGRFRPHRTHQNGLSVDFMVPVIDKSGRSVPLPTSAWNEFGYGIKFDSAGRYEDDQIDFEAMAEHLYQLHAAASARGVGIGLVIFEPEYHAKLFATKRGEFLRSLPWMKKQAWIRHDNHYHVDFVVPCSPLH